MIAEVFRMEALQISDEELFRAIRLDPEDAEEEDIARVLEMRDEACRAAIPKYLIGEAKVTAFGEDWVELDGKRFRSPLVRKNLEGVGTVYPFLATCGQEVEAWSKTLSDPFEEFWADSIKLLILGRATAALDVEAKKRFPGGHFARMNPGSLPAWPLSAQRDLFGLIGEDTLGIRLTDSCLMLPSKSVSGFFFHSEDGFVNCAFCTILSCPNRRAAFVGEVF